jgi:hypothetical protein
MKIEELAAYAEKLIDANPLRWRRLRIVVTQTELEDLRKWARDHDQVFVRCIRGIPIADVVMDEVEAEGERVIHDNMCA